jgi:hypothetical protein
VFVNDVNLMADELVSIPAADLAAVMPFRAHGDVRYYLDGIYVEPCDAGGCMIVATEGHMLGAIHSPEARTDKARLLRITDGFEGALKGRNTLNNGVVSLAAENARITLRINGIEEYVQPGIPFIDGKFPDWRKVVPPVEHIQPGISACLQSRYLAKLWKTCPIERYAGVFLSHDARNPDAGAAIVQFVRSPSLIVLIMAMKFERPPLPDWIPREPAKKEDAA